MRTTYPTFSKAWAESLWSVMYSGDLTSPRGMDTLEQRWSQVQVDDPLSFPVTAEGRKFRDVIGVLEALSLVGQFSVPELFTKRVAKFSDFIDAGVFHGAYGPRAHGAFGDLVSLFERDPDTRQGVITVFDSTRDLDRTKRDIPCTISLHFMKRGSDLELNVTMRSNDVWLGTPYDFIQFAVLQASIAQALGLSPGTYTHSAGSLHLYRRNVGEAERVIAAGEHRPMSYPLWGCESEIGAITQRARQLALGDDFMPVTEFEAWAWSMLFG